MTVSQLYEAYFIAEHKWQALLVERFGDAACDARYDKRGRGAFGEPLGEAFLAYRKAQMAYFAAYDLTRAA